MDSVYVEVAYARPDVQRLLKIQVPAAATVRDAIQASGLLEEFEELDIEQIEAGVFSKPVRLEHPISDGDRVEIYRPLVIDPKEARRRRAGGNQQKT